MINTTCLLEEIQFKEEDPGTLFESIQERGIAIPIQVNKTKNGYECVDGRKRLTACKVLSKEDEKFKRIPIWIMNDYSQAGNAFWGNQNHH